MNCSHQGCEESIILEDIVGWWCQQHWWENRKEAILMQDYIDCYAGLPMLEVYPFTIHRIAKDSVPFGPVAVHYITQTIEKPPV